MGKNNKGRKGGEWCGYGGHDIEVEQRVTKNIPKKNIPKIAKQIVRIRIGFVKVNCEKSSFREQAASKLRNMAGADIPRSPVYGQDTSCQDWSLLLNSIILLYYSSSQLFLLKEGGRELPYFW